MCSNEQQRWQDSDKSQKSETDVRVQALIPKGSSVCLLCSEWGHLRGCCLMSGCWGAASLLMLPSGCQSALSILAFLVWQALQVYCRVMLCATSLKPATRTKLVGKPSSC